MAIKIKNKRYREKDNSRPLTANLKDEFEAFLFDHGLKPDPKKPILFDGSINRGYIEENGKTKMVGWFQCWLDQEVPFGQLGDWRIDQQNPTAKWKPSNAGAVTLTDEQRAEIERLKAQAAVEKKEKQNRAAKRAQNMWNRAQDIEIHAYLRNKNVENHGLKADHNNNLLVPMWNKDLDIVGLQFIAEDGEKRFLTGSKKQGSFYILGLDDLETCKTISYAEGYATAASYYEDTKQPTIVTFDAYNLTPVAETIVEFFADKHHLFIADHDDSETGEREAVKAAQAVRARGATSEVVMPVTKGDYNDHKNAEPTNEVEAIEGEVIPSLQNVNVPQSYEFQRNSRGGYLSTKENIRGVLVTNDISARYNVIKKRMEITVPQTNFIQDLAEEAALIEIEDRCIQMGMPHQRVRDCLKLLAEEYNPVKEWIDSKPWDGKSRLQMFFDTITADDRKLKEMLMLKWMISCIAAAYEPEGVELEGILLFQGAQGLGKTLWFKKLCPSNEDWLLEGATINPADKDSVKQLVSHWIVEAGEIESTFKKADIDQLKAFITKRSDELRLPYDRAFSSYKRRTSFFASVNQREFLVDTSGNRRFWVVPVTAIDNKHKLIMQQVWAEVKEQHYVEGEKNWFLTEEERQYLHEANEMHRTQSSVEDLILECVDFESEYKKPVQMTKLLRDLGIQNPRMNDFKEASRVLSENGAEPRRTQGRKVYDISYTPLEGAEGGNDTPF